MGTEGRGEPVSVAGIADCLFVGRFFGARTNKWKQIISWPHYAEESMGMGMGYGRGYRLPQGDGNEANECRATYPSLMPSSGPRVPLHHHHYHHCHPPLLL